MLCKKHFLWCFLSQFLVIIRWVLKVRFLELGYSEKWKKKVWDEREKQALSLRRIEEFSWAVVEHLALSRSWTQTRSFLVTLFSYGPWSLSLDMTFKSILQATAGQSKGTPINGPTVIARESWHVLV